MSRPEVKLDLSNAEEVYDYYTKKLPNRHFMRGFHALLNGIFHPRTVHGHEAKTAIDDHLRQDKQLLIAVSHSSWFDPCHAAAALNKEKVFKPAIGRINIPGKGEILNWPVIGPIANAGGALPVYRKKELIKSGTFSQENNERRKEFGNKLIGLTAQRLDSGLHVAYFPEGTRRDRTDSVIGRIHRGIGETACLAQRPEDLLLVCLGIDYGEDGSNLVRPNIGIQVAPHLGPSPEVVTKQTKETLQASLDLAIASR